MPLDAKLARKAEKPARPLSAADRIQTPPFKPSKGLTRRQIDKAVREVMAKRDAHKG